MGAINGDTELTTIYVSVILKANMGKLNIQRLIRRPLNFRLAALLILVLILPSKSESKVIKKHPVNLQTYSKITTSRILKKIPVRTNGRKPNFQAFYKAPKTTGTTPPFITDPSLYLPLGTVEQYTTGIIAGSSPRMNSYYYYSADARSDKQLVKEVRIMGTQIKTYEFINGERQAPVVTEYHYEKGVSPEPAVKLIKNQDLSLPQLKAILKEYSPEAFLMTENVKNKQIFDITVDFVRTRAGWIPALEVGVHEALHAYDRQTALTAGQFYTYNLMDEKQVKWPSDSILDFFLTESMLDESRRDEFSHAYLPNNTRGALNRRDIHYIFRELNAYTAGTDIRIKLAEVVQHVPGHESLGSGIEHMLFYLGSYLHQVKLAKPETYKKIQTDEAKNGVAQALWTQAEGTLEKACLSKHVAIESTWLKYAFEEANQKALMEAFGPEFRIKKPKSCNFP